MVDMLDKNNKKQNKQQKKKMCIRTEASCFMLNWNEDFVCWMAVTKWLYNVIMENL